MMAHCCYSVAFHHSCMIKGLHNRIKHAEKIRQNLYSFILFSNHAGSVNVVVRPGINVKVDDFLISF